VLTSGFTITFTFNVNAYVSLINLASVSKGYGEGGDQMVIKTIKTYYLIGL